MMVTSIVPIDKRKSKVFLDEGFAFVLYKNELERYGIYEGGSISDFLYDEIEREVLDQRARERCLNLLKDSDRSESQLRARLSRESFPKAVIDRAVEFLKEYRYVDDQRMADYYMERGSRLKSRRQLVWELSGKGMDQETIQNALGKALPESEAICRLAMKRTGGRPPETPQELRKLYGYLGRKGFSFEEIRSALEELWNKPIGEFPQE